MLFIDTNFKRRLLLSAPIGLIVFFCLLLPASAASHTATVDLAATNSYGIILYDTYRNRSDYDPYNQFVIWQETSGVYYLAYGASLDQGQPVTILKYDRSGISSNYSLSISTDNNFSLSCGRFQYVSNCGQKFGNFSLASSTHEDFKFKYIFIISIVLFLIVFLFFVFRKKTLTNIRGKGWTVK